MQSYRCNGTVPLSNQGCFYERSKPGRKGGWSVVGYGYDEGGAAVKPDELSLFLALADEHGGPYNPNQGRCARQLGKELGLHPKRVNYLCQKWTHKALYSYGVAVDLGWLEPQGWVVAREMRGHQ